MLFLEASKTCEDLTPIISVIKNGVMPIIQIGIPILLIIMGSLDLGKAVVASDDKEIKAATSRLVKRAIAAAAVFFVVLIVKLLINLVANNTSSNQVAGADSWATCWEAA